MRARCASPTRRWVRRRSSGGSDESSGGWLRGAQPPTSESGCSLVAEVAHSTETGSNGTCDPPGTGHGRSHEDAFKLGRPPADAYVEPEQRYPMKINDRQP